MLKLVLNSYCNTRISVNHLMSQKEYVLRHTPAVERINKWIYKAKKSGENTTNYSYTPPGDWGTPRRGNNPRKYAKNKKDQKPHKKMLTNTISCDKV